MSTQQVVFVACAFLFIIGITTLAMLRWLPTGTIKFVLVFAAGAGTAAALRIANVPPSWFDGSKQAFGMTLFFAAWGFVSSKNVDERTFGRPLLLGMALTLLVLNVAALVMRRI